jgi:hypothetical protein
VNVSDFESGYRTPDEKLLQEMHRARVRTVLDAARADAASIVAAMVLGESTAVVNAWVDRLWNGLRDNLSDNHPADPLSTLRVTEDRLLAIVMLLEDQARATARALVAEHNYPENLT